MCRETWQRCQSLEVEMLVTGRRWVYLPGNASCVKIDRSDIAVLWQHQRAQLTQVKPLVPRALKSSVIEIEAINVDNRSHRMQCIHSNAKSPRTFVRGLLGPRHAVGELVIGMLQAPEHPVNQI